MKKILAHLISGKVNSNDPQAHSLFESKSFGEKSGEKIIYSIYEALFLVEKKYLEVLDLKNKNINEQTLQKKFSKITKNFSEKYSIFKDLRKKGYIVKTALKFGAEFRVYEKPKNKKKTHSKWIVLPINENQKISWRDFAAKSRVAHSINKPLLIAIVDEEEKISYYENHWKKLA